MAEDTGYIMLTVKIEPADGQFAAECLELGTASCGDTVQNAFDNLVEATKLYLEALEETGQRTRVLQEKGISSPS